MFLGTKAPRGGLFALCLGGKDVIIQSAKIIAFLCQFGSDFFGEKITNLISKTFDPTIK